MEIIAFIGIGVILFAIGIFFGSSMCSCHDPIMCDFNEVRLRKLGELELKVFVIEQENKRLNYLYESSTREKRLFNEYMATRCSNCNKNFFAKTLKEKDVADMLKNITLTSEEIAKKLDIKIT